MKLYSIWQPLTSEDARTALVFGFLRHAPVEHGLAPWLTDVLGRPVTAKPLEPENFWPRFASRLEDHEWTEPDLVIEAADGDPLVVVVEAKPGYGMHGQEQLTRELIDSAHAASAKRVALVAVGADIGDPLELDQWRTAARVGLDAHGLHSTDVEIHYSSWARLGARIEACSMAFPALQTYADDALAQLHFNALLGYKGAPMLDDLDEMTLMNAFVAFNRALLSAREFFLTLHDQTGFRATGLKPIGNGHHMRRNGTSTALTQHAEFFVINNLVSSYRKTRWAKDLGAFAAFYFGDEDHPKLQVGAFASASPGNLHWDYAATDTVEELEDVRLAALDKKDLPLAAALGSRLQLAYDERPWTPNQADADVAWAIEKLDSVAAGLN